MKHMIRLNHTHIKFMALFTAWCQMGILAAGLMGCSHTYDNKMASITADGIKSHISVSMADSLKQNEKTQVLGLPPEFSNHPLSADDSALIALTNNAQLSVDMAALGFAHSDLLEAGLIRNPRLDLLFPVGLKPFELLLNLPIESIWERPRRVKAAEKAYEQIATSLIQNGLNTIHDARVAHANFNLAREREAILHKASELRTRIAKINGQQRFGAGEVNRAEGLAAEVDSATAEELWWRASHETALAAVRFRVTLGVILDATHLELQRTTPAIVTPEPLESLIEKSLSTRPDLQAAELAVTAAAQRARWESVRLSQLALILGAKRVGDNGVLFGPGLSVELPIFNQNQGRKSRADAEVEQAARQYLALKQRVVFEVSESRQLLIQAQEVLKRTRERVLPLLEKSVAFAEKKYRQQSASYLFVLEQTRNLVDAQLRVADFEAAMLRADAYLRRSLGAG